MNWKRVDGRQDILVIREETRVQIKTIAMETEVERSKRLGD